MSAAERHAYHGDHPVLDPLVAKHIADITAAHTLIYIYPTWWSGLPAILKGWFERVMVPGTGFVFDAKGKVRPGLTNVRRLVGVSTYGSRWAYVKAINDNGRRTIMRAMRLSTGHAHPIDDGWRCTASTSATPGDRAAVPRSLRATGAIAVNVLIVFCHPTHESFTGASLQRVLAGLATAASRRARIVDLYAERFRPELSIDEHGTALDRPSRRPDLRAGIAGHIEHLQWAEALVFVYPTWWAGQPAMLKGWFDRVLVNGVAWHLPDGADRIRPLLTNIRRLVVVTSHGSTKFVNALEGEGGKRRRRRARAVHGDAARVVALYDIDRHVGQAAGVPRPGRAAAWPSVRLGRDHDEIEALASLLRGHRGGRHRHRRPRMPTMPSSGTTRPGRAEQGRQPAHAGIRRPHLAGRATTTSAASSSTTASCSSTCSAACVRRGTGSAGDDARLGGRRSHHRLDEYLDTAQVAVLAASKRLTTSTWWVCGNRSNTTLSTSR